MANVTETQQRKQTEGSRRGRWRSGGVAEVGLIWSGVGRGGRMDGGENRALAVGKYLLRENGRRM